jgi:hypothetical protein
MYLMMMDDFYGEFVANIMSGATHKLLSLSCPSESPYL